LVTVVAEVAPFAWATGTSPNASGLGATAIDGLMPHVGPEHVGLLKATRSRFPQDPFLRFAVNAALTRLGR
jgi:hypothetical protein